MTFRFAFRFIHWLALAASGFALQAQQPWGNDIDGLAGRMDEAVTRSGKVQIAVLDFTDLDGKGNALGQQLADDLRYYLLQRQAPYSILERRFLDRVIEEQRLSAQATVDEERAIQLGKLMSADAILFGTIRPDGRRATITTKLINTETGVLIAMDRMEVRLSSSAARDMRRRNGVDYQRRSAADSRDRGNQQEFIPIELFAMAGTQIYHDRALPSVGAQAVLRHVGNQIGKQRVAGTAWVFGLYAAPGSFNDVNNAGIGLGYRQPLGFDDSIGLIRAGNSTGVQGGDVWLLDRYEEEFLYALPQGLDAARVAHVQLSNISINHFSTDLWYKFYLTPHHTYSNVFKPYLGFGMGISGLFYSADFSGMEWFVQREPGIGGSTEYTQSFTPITDTQFPFNRFKNHLFYYDWTMYFGVEHSRFGLQLTGGISRLMGGSPLILPYLNQSYASGREAERKLQEDGLLVFERVFDRDDPRSTISSKNPFAARLSAAIRITYRLN